MGNPRILVADDDAWILRMVTTVLEKRGYEVITASDGKEAYETAIASSPDLVITDVMMPNMDGWALIKALRSTSDFAFIPVIFLTALAGDDDRIRGFRLGADDYLPKPFRFEELDLRVTKTLERTTQLEAMAREQMGFGDDSIDPLDSLGGSEPKEPSSTVAKSALQGSLEQVGLSALLILLEMESKSGVLKVTDPSTGTVGSLFLRNGSLVDACLSDAETPKGEQCVYQLLSWTSGTFEFALGDVDNDDVIQANTTHLLMEAARLFDEQNA